MTNKSLIISLSISVLLHLFFVIIIYLANFSFKKEINDEKIMVIDVVKVAEKNNVKTQRTEEKTNKSEREEARKIQQSKSIPEPKTNKLEKKALNPKSTDVAKDKGNVPVKKNAVEDKKNKQAVPAKSKPKEVKKATKKPTDIELESLMKTLQKASDGKKSLGRKKAEVEAAKGDINAKGNKAQISENMTISEYQNIKQQIESNWKVPVGVRNAGSMKVVMYIKLKKDGVVEKVELKDKVCKSVSLSLCQAAAEFAERAVWLSSPLQNLSQQRYHIWQEFNIEFDPSEISE